MWKRGNTLELTDTNRAERLDRSLYKVNKETLIYIGGNGEKVPPVPIPNTEVKLLSADGTARVAVWESRSLPIVK